MKKVRVLVVEDHPITQAGIYAILETAPDLTPMGKAASSQEALTLAFQRHPDVLLLGMCTSGLSSTELVTTLRQQCPHTQILMLNDACDATWLHELAELGIAGYILKNEAPDVIINAIQTVAQGDTWFSQPVITKLISRPDYETPTNDLTTKELTILQWVASEKTDKEIAHSLSVSERTIRKYLRHIYDKLGVDSRAGACYEAGKRRFFDE